MIRKISAVFAAILIILSVTGCSDDGLDRVLKYDIPDNPGTLDPQQSDDAVSELIIGNIFCGLFRKNADGTLRNGVCEEYSVSEDGLTYRFRLRDDVYWVADDYEAPCTAADFVFGFQRLFNPETNAPHAEDYYCIKNSEAIHSGTVTDLSKLGVRALGEYELEITLEYTNPRFLDLLCDVPSMPCNEEFFVKSRGKYGLSAEDTPSNGAFYLTEWTYDPYAVSDINNLTLSRNYLNAETFGVCPSGLNFFIEDEDDFLADFLDETTSVIVLNASLKSLSEYPCDEYASITCGLVFNRDFEPFANEDFLKALTLLVNRDEIISGISGYEEAEGAVPTGVTVDGDGYRETVGNAITAGFDEDAAAELFKTAKQSLVLSELNGARIIVSDEVSATAVSYIMQVWQRELGFYCVLEQLSESAFKSRLESGDYEIALQKLSGKYDSPAAYLEQFLSGSSYNYSGYSSEEFDALLEEAGKAADLSESVELYAEAETLLIEQSGFVPLYYENVYFYTQGGVDDVYYNPFTGAIDFTFGKRK